MNIEIVTDHDIFDECMEQMAQQRLVLDLDGRHRFHKRLSTFREILTGVHYYCLDILHAPDLDVIGNLLQLPFAAEVAGRCDLQFRA